MLHITIPLSSKTTQYALLDDDDLPITHLPSNRVKIQLAANKSAERLAKAMSGSAIVFKLDSDSVHDIPKLDFPEDWLAFDRAVNDCITTNGIDLILEPCPTTAAAKEKWQAFNRRFTSRIRVKLNDNGRALIEKVDVWKEAHNRLRRNYKLKDGATFRTTMESLLSVKSRFTNVTTLQNEMEQMFAKLQGIGQGLTEAQKAYCFLRALPDEYSDWINTHLTIYTFLEAESTGDAPKMLVGWNEIAYGAKDRERGFTEAKEAEETAVALAASAQRNNRKRPAPWSKDNKCGNTNDNGGKRHKFVECPHCKKLNRRNTRHPEERCFVKHPHLLAEHVKRLTADVGTAAAPMLSAEPYNDEGKQ